MKNTQRLLILAAFLTASCFILFGPAVFSGRGQTRSGPMPEQTQIPNNGRPVFIEFYSQGCSICRQLAPGIKQLNEELSDRVEFIMIDSDDPANTQLVEQFQVYGLPAFFWITADRQIMDHREGYLPIDEIRGLILKIAETAPGGKT